MLDATTCLCTVAVEFFTNGQSAPERMFRIVSVIADPVGLWQADAQRSHDAPHWKPGTLSNFREVRGRLPFDLAVQFGVPREQTMAVLREGKPHDMTRGFSDVALVVERTQLDRMPSKF